MNLAIEPRPSDLLWPPLAYLVAIAATSFALSAIRMEERVNALFMPMLVASIATIFVMGMTKRRVPFSSRGASVALMAAVLFGAVTLVANKAVGELEEPTDLSLAVSDLSKSSDLILAFIVIVFAAPLVEECYFRGMIYPWFAGRVGDIGGAVLAALLFAMLHPGGTTFYLLFVISFFWSVMVRLTGNLLSPTVGHMSVNAVSFAMLVIHGQWGNKLTWTDIAFAGALCLVSYCLAGYWASRRSRTQAEAFELTGRTLYSVGLAVLISITIASLIVGAPVRRS